MKRYIVEGRNSPREAFRLVAAPSYATLEDARKACDEVAELYTRERIPFQGRVREEDAK